MSSSFSGFLYGLGFGLCLGYTYSLITESAMIYPVIGVGLACMLTSYFIDKTE